MLELHDRNVQHNNILIDNIMLHWELDKRLKIGVYEWGCTSHMGENVEIKWHAETKDAKQNLEKEKIWVASKLFRDHNRRYQDPSRNYTKLRVLWLENLHGNIATMVMTQYSMQEKVIKFEP